MKPTTPVRIGLIGLGIMGELYAKVYTSHPLARLVAVSSRRQSKVDEFSARFAAKGYTDYREMIEQAELDAVCNCDTGSCALRIRTHGPLRGKTRSD